MDDDSSSLKSEWKLLLHGFLGDKTKEETDRRGSRAQELFNFEMTSEPKKQIQQKDQLNESGLKSRNRLRPKALEKSPDGVEKLKKELSEKRKLANQKIEEIKLQIEDKIRTHENLKLVGSDISELEDEIERLFEEGQNLTLEVAELDRQLRLVRSIEV